LTDQLRVNDSRLKWIT